MLDILTSCVLIRIVSNPINNTKLIPKQSSFQEVLWIVLAVVGLYSSKQMDSQILPDFHRISLHPIVTILVEDSCLNLPDQLVKSCWTVFSNILPKRSLSKLLTTSQPKKNMPMFAAQKIDQWRSSFGVRDFGRIHVYIYTHKYTRSYVLMWFMWKIWMFQDCFGLRVWYGYILLIAECQKNNEKMYKLPSTNFAKSWFKKILSKGCLQDLSWQ